MAHMLAVIKGFHVGSEYLRAHVRRTVVLVDHLVSFALILEQYIYIALTLLPNDHLIIGR